MKNLIKQILREETSGLTDTQIKAGYKMMNHITKGYYWYHDTPEQPFEYSRGSIWLINPDTTQWFLELEKSGELNYYYKTHEKFYKYLNIERDDFESFIKIWVEDVLERSVNTTLHSNSLMRPWVRDAIRTGVVTTKRAYIPNTSSLKDIVKNGEQMK